MCALASAGARTYPDVEIVTLEPVVMLPVDDTASWGYALTGSDGLSLGQAVMKLEASVYTSLGVKGTSCG